MLDNEAEREPDGEETDEHNLADLRKKYPWWLSYSKERRHLHCLKGPSWETQ